MRAAAARRGSCSPGHRRRRVGLRQRHESEPDSCTRGWACSQSRCCCASCRSAWFDPTGAARPRRLARRRSRRARQRRRRRLPRRRAVQRARRRRAAHARRGRRGLPARPRARPRIYLTLNILLKPAELVDALLFLGEAIDRGVDAAIVQDIGLVRLIQRVYPGFEIHGSTQMTVHDASGARVMRELGIDRVVLARENTLDDIRAIKSAVPGARPRDVRPRRALHLVHRPVLHVRHDLRAQRESRLVRAVVPQGLRARPTRRRTPSSIAATSSRRRTSPRTIISPRSPTPASGCLKVEGRKKKPEYVATVTHGYRDFLDRVERGRPHGAAVAADVEPLVQIYSRGFTGGMYGGRAGRDYITREHPDNRGRRARRRRRPDAGELIVELSAPLTSATASASRRPDAMAARRSASP